MSTIDGHEVDVAILVALGLEAGPMVAAMIDCVKLTAAEGRRIVVGRWGCRRVAVVTCGVGKEASLSGVRLAVTGHRPRLLIAAGLCGGLAPQLGRGEVVIAAEVVGPGGGSLEPPDTSNLLDPTSLPRVRLVTADRVVETPDAKQSLREATGADVVDMESWWIAKAAAEAGVRWCVIRAVSDTAADGIPADIAPLAAAKHPARLAGAAVRLLFRRPTAIADMAQLREQACNAADRLAAKLEAMLSHRPTSSEPLRATADRQPDEEALGEIG